MAAAAAFSSVIVRVLLLVGASCAAVIATDADSPSPASQPTGAGVRSFSRQMESSIDDLMNALARVTKSKGNKQAQQHRNTAASFHCVFINSIGNDRVWAKEKHALKKQWRHDGAAR